MDKSRFEHLVEKRMRKKEQEKQAETLDFNTLLEMMEQLGDLAPLSEVKKGFRGREYALRMRPMVATEISVGQEVSSEERKLFVTWMRNIGGKTPGEKIKRINDFITSPGFKSEDSPSIAQTLSYSMFLTTFAFIIKEFNPAVAGFLWEPMLAAIFGGEGARAYNASRQVPTGEHDIADIRIESGGKQLPISLKVLRKAGRVGGSFKDLVSHFTTNPDEPLQYIIISKEGSDIMTFYEFTFTRETVRKFLGTLSATKPEIKTVPKFKFSNLRSNILKVQPAKSDTQADLPENKTKEDRLYVRHFSGATPVGKWIHVASKKSGGYKTTKNVSQIKLRTVAAPGTEIAANVYLDMDADYLADLAKYKAGGRSAGDAGAPRGVTLVTKTETTAQQDAQDAKLRAGKRSKNSEHLWGKDAVMFMKWMDLLDDTSVPTQRAFELIKDGGSQQNKDGTIVDYDQAIGVAKNVQFEIDASQYKTLGEKMGEINISFRAMNRFYREAAEHLQQDIVTMFEKLETLNDNITKFFLVECEKDKSGVSSCSPAAVSARGKAGDAAKQDAEDLQDAVDSAVTRMTKE